MLCVVMDQEQRDFERFVSAVEPRLRRALVAGFGPVAGREAAADALAWAWQNWDRARSLDSPVGYLFKVGRTLATRGRGRDLPVAQVRDVRAEPDDSFEPGLLPALTGLSEAQRCAVVLVVGWGYTLRDAAEVLGVTASTVHRDVGRALDRLRTKLEVEDVC